jgi:succinate dehydrogenase/fumarate reductase flavoprotein subunit
MAHYQMGGVRIDESMQTCVEGLYAAGEVVGGANGANRLSGNAITEALVFGERAGKMGARKVLEKASPASAGGWKSLAAIHARDMESLAARGQSPGAPTPPALQQQLKQVMNEKVGPLRKEEGLRTALETIRELRQEVLPHIGLSPLQPFNLDIQDWLELRNMLDTAELVVQPALSRRESRGAHQREDFPDQQPDWERNQVLSLKGDEIILRSEPVVRVTPEAG